MRHSICGVCNPSRYAILSGTYFWHAKRKQEEIVPLAETFLQDQMHRIGKSGIVFSEEAKTLWRVTSSPGMSGNFTTLLKASSL